MALINPSSRKGLNGMITGHVDREWGKHHYRRWYRDHHEADEALEIDEQPPEETCAASSSPVGPAPDLAPLILR